jgi:hypothetical protein
MIKIPNFYASSPLHNENIISETDKDSILEANPKMKIAINDHNKKNRSESIAGNPFSEKSSKRFKTLESMKFKHNDTEYNATNLIKD